MVYFCTTMPVLSVQQIACLSEPSQPHLCGMRVASLGHMTMDLKVLQCGNCEELKLGIHATTLGLAALCGLYNAAAWLSRRERHLAINAVMYTALIVIEQRHVAHHIATLRREAAAGAAVPTQPVLVPNEPPAVAA